MNRNDLVDRIAAISGAIGGAIVYTLLFVAMQAPVSETAIRLVA